MVATKPNSKKGEWHLLFSDVVFMSYKDAATKAFEMMSKDSNYLYRPVAVIVECLEELETDGLL